MTDDALTAARELLPLITRLREDTENDRRIARPIVDALLGTRLCRMAIPRTLGGLELPPVEMLAVYETLAGAEASVAWIVWNNVLPALFGRFLESDTRQEIFGDPAWMYASSTRPSGRAALEDDAYRVEGRWSLVSGCELAEWLALRCVVLENGQPRMLQPGVPEARFVYVRRGEFEILDTWHTGGLRGSGSHDVVVKALRVPRRRTCSPADGNKLHGAFGRAPIVCTMAAGYAAQILGMAATAVATLIALTRSKVGAEPGPALAERPAVLASIARHGAALAAARGHLHACVARQWAIVETTAPSLEGITAVWTAAHHAMEQGRQALEAMYAAGGASSLYKSSPLERAHRDLHAMSAHVIAQPFWIEDAGRVQLGQAPLNPLYGI